MLINVVKRSSGLSLTETVVALFLASMLVVVLVNLFPSAVAAMRTSEAKAQAVDLTESLLAEQKARPFSELVPGPATTLDPVKRGPIVLQPRLQIFEIPGRNPDYLRGARVTVSWKTSRQTREVSQEVWLARIKK
jgi:hypothetical protein